MIDQHRLRALKRRWNDEKKVSAPDVRWLIDLADAQATKESADLLRRKDPVSELLDGLFRR